MSSITFAEILASLPECDAFPMADDLPKGIGYRHPDMSGFVEPNLVLIEGEELPESQVLIVSAAGAVGKSTLAEALSSRKNSLFWDLAVADEVAGGSLDGLLGNALGHDFADEYELYLEEGMQFLVIDALDEGRFKVNESSFRRMLENVAKLAKNARGVCFILLGRTRIAEESWLVLSEEGIRAALLAIHPFDRAQADDYIDRKLSPEKRTPLFEECRKMVFDQLASSVTEGPGSDVPSEFLHYPPVLDVIVTLIEAEDNPLQLKNYLQDQNATTVGSPVSLLANVIEHILDREQHEKIIPQLQSLLPSTADFDPAIDWGALFTRDEQCQRLLAIVLDVPSVNPHVPLQEHSRSVYEQHISSHLQYHPFLQGVDKFANSVFESYLFALALSSKLGNVLRDRVTAELIKPDLLPTRLLGEFYLKPTNGAMGDQLIIVPEHLGILYDSLASSESSTNHIRLNLDGLNPFDLAEEIGSETIEGEFEIWSVSLGEARLIEERAFAMVVGSDSMIRFARYLRDVFMTVPCGVEMGANTGEFQIGPSVQVTAKSISVLADHLIVGGNTILKPNEEEAEDVILESLSFDQNSVCSRITLYPNSALNVSWPGSGQYPWTQYSNSSQALFVGDDETLHRAYMRFKRIATAFRSHSKGALARTVQKIRHQRVLQNELGRNVLEQLENDDILILGDGGRRYFWNSERADKLLGVSWQDLRRGECPETLRTYLSQVVNSIR